MLGYMYKMKKKKKTKKKSESNLASMYGDPNKITRGDVIAAAKKIKG